MTTNQHSFNTGDTVLQPSSLKGYRWPSSNPTETHQRVRKQTVEDVHLVRQCAATPEINWKAFHKETRDLTTAGKVHHLLTHRKFQFNTVGLVRQEPRWQENITKAVTDGQPILVTYPLMCKVGNWAKQMTNIGPHAGEDCTLFFFAHLNSLVGQIYEPGLRFKILADARLYNSAFKISEVEVSRYLSALRKQVKAFGIDHIIEIVDYADVLEAHACDDYLERYFDYQNRMVAGDESVLSGINVPSLLDSVEASINTRPLGMSYGEHLSIFSSQGVRSGDSSPLAKEVSQMATTAFREVVAIRKACGDVDICNRAWPDAVRVTCHKGAKNGTWHPGLRVYPEYYGSSKLLPYHGVALVRTDRQGRPKLEIHPEVLLRGCSDFVRVTQAGGCVEEVYFYDAIHLPPDHSFDFLHDGSPVQAQDPVVQNTAA